MCTVKNTHQLFLLKNHNGGITPWILGTALDEKKCFPLYNLPPKMAAAYRGLITNAGLMAAGMSYSYSSQKQTTSLYLYI